MATINLSATKLKAKDPAELVRFTYYADPERFVKAFENAGVGGINESTLPNLINLIISGNDKKGVMKRPSGAPVVFDGMNILYNVTIRHDMLDKSGIKIV